MGGAGHKQAHNVFIWDRDSGVLVKVLEGPRESLIHCDVSLSSLQIGKMS
jgi:COMPASS component SWD1